MIDVAAHRFVYSAKKNRSKPQEKNQQLFNDFDNKSRERNVLS